MAGIQASFGTVILVVVALGAVVAVLALLSTRKGWEEFGRSRLVMDRDEPSGPALGAGSAAAIRERDDDIRALLEARNERRRRRGEAVVDVETELRRLTAPVLDDELRSEIRDLVMARNFRRARAGRSLLDVEAEIAREIQELGDPASGAQPVG